MDPIVSRKDFTTQGDMPTPTSKLKRRVVQKRYHDAIESLSNFGWRPTSPVGADPVIRRDTVIHNFLARSVELADDVIFKWPVDGEWKGATGTEVRRLTEETCAGLLAMGMAVGDRVGIVARNSPEWLIADYAIQHAAGISVPLYCEFADAQFKQCINDAGCRYVFVDDNEILERLFTLTLTGVEWFIVADGQAADPRVVTLTELRRRGAQLLETDPQALADRLEMISDSDVFTIVYTSGTTGPPKGVALSHRNAMFAATRYLKRIAPHKKQTLVSYGPLSHITGRIIISLIPTVAGAPSGEIWFVPDLALLLEAFRRARPTALLGAPRFWMKIRARILAELEAAPKRDRWIRKLIDSAATTVRHRREGRPVSVADTLKAWLAREIVGRQIKKHLGLDRVWSASSGAAPLPAEVQYFFQAIGIPLRQAWAMTETCGAGASQAVDDLEAGITGPPHDDVEIRIADDGEVLLRGDCVFAGYWGKPDATAEVIDDDGWLHTGDIGEFTVDGRLRILDRKKDYFTLSSGKNISPQRIENRLRASPLVLDAMAVGEGRPHAAVLVSLDPEEVAAGLAARQATPSGAAETHPRVRAEIRRLVDSYNDEVSPAERVGAWHIVEGGFPTASYTPTLKFKRDSLHHALADDIERLYLPDAHSAGRVVRSIPGRQEHR
jgi:long-chain acyl-CoA synthetase